MPRTKLAQKDPLEILIRIYCVKRSTDITRLCENINMTRKLMYDRFKAPDNFTRRELRKISRSLQIPESELYSAMFQ